MENESIIGAKYIYMYIYQHNNISNPPKHSHAFAKKKKKKKADVMMLLQSVQIQPVVYVHMFVCAVCTLSTLLATA